MGRLDPHGETHFGTSQMQHLVAEVDLLLALAKAGAEHHGLIQLRSGGALRGAARRTGVYRRLSGPNARIAADPDVLIKPGLLPAVRVHGTG
ncbi:hypothetical protein ACLQ2Y_14905 [Micromonospora echinospora]|uniref:hypothetical protein n=1 Tax=Micromonospora echinospora TaxID=1877 RepID=UPI003CF475C5